MTVTNDLEYAKQRLAYYKAKPGYQTENFGKIYWSLEIAFWQKKVEELSQ